MASLVSSSPGIVAGTSTTGALPPRDPAAWSLSDAKNAVAASYPVQYDKEAAKSVADYVQGLHYQEGRPWMGSGYSREGTLDESSRSLIARMLAPVPEAYACLERRVDAICGIQAAISLIPTDPQGAPDENGEKTLSPEQARLAKEWPAQLSKWIDNERAWGGKDLRKPTGVRGMVAQASASQSGSACLRLFLNPASRTLEVAVRDQGGQVVPELRIPRQADRAAALRHIKIVAPPPENCAVYTDPDTHEKRGVFLFASAEGQERAEVWFARGEMTVLRIVAGNETLDEREYPWGGWLPIQQANIGCLLTDAVRRDQGAADFVATALMRLVQSMAWGQRTEIDAEDDGFWSSTAPLGVSNPRTRETESGGTEYFNPVPAGLGPEVIRKLRSYQYSTGSNKEGETFARTAPSVHYHDPSDPSGLIQVLDGVIMLIRYACHQGHIRSGLLGSSAEASGEAYEQARAAFVADINGGGEEVDAAFAPTLMTATIMADWLTGNDDPAQFAKDWTVLCQSHPSAGNPSASSQQETRANVDAELLSPEEGTARLNVQDVAAERARIAAGNTLAASEKRWTIITTAVGAGFDRTAVLEDMGFPPDKIEKLVRTDGPPNITQ